MSCQTIAAARRDYTHRYRRVAHGACHLIDRTVAAASQHRIILARIDGLTHTTCRIARARGDVGIHINTGLGQPRTDALGKSVFALCSRYWIDYEQMPWHIKCIDTPFSPNSIKFARDYQQSAIHFRARQGVESKGKCNITKND